MQRRDFIKNTLLASLAVATSRIAAAPIMQQRENKTVNPNMAKKIVIINGSPRRNNNTATLLKEAQRGAESIGAEVEYIDLVKLNFKGCMSCFACKRKGNTCNGLCAWKDDLRPVLESIHQADALIIGSPIYWSYPTGMFRNLIERLLFPILRYDIDEATGGASKYLDKKMPTAIIYTMNNSKERYNMVNYGTILAPDQQYLQQMFGSCEVLNAYETWQFPDYERYDASAFNLSHLQSVRENQWPKDKQAAFDLAIRLLQ